MKYFLMAAVSMVSFVSVSAFGAQINFDLKKGVAVGADCNAQDLSHATAQLRVFASGKTLSVVTKALSLDLPNAGLAERKKCTIRIPAALQAGYTIKSMTQRATYGVFKTDGAVLALSFHAASVGAGSLINKSFAREVSVDQPTASAVSKVVLSSAEQQALCTNSQFIQKLDLAASAQLTDFGSQLSVGRQNSGDVKLDISFELVRCPL